MNRQVETAWLERPQPVHTRTEEETDRDTPESIILQLVKQWEIDVKEGLNIDLNEFGPALLKKKKKRQLKEETATPLRLYLKCREPALH